MTESSDPETRILQITTADDWRWEDRTAASGAMTRESDGYWYSHERLIGWALCQVTDRSGDMWTEVRGVVRWFDVQQTVDSDECHHVSELPDCDEATNRDAPGTCSHYQSLPKPAPSKASTNLELVGPTPSGLAH